MPHRHLYFRLSLLMFLQFFVWGSWFVTLGTYLLQTLKFSGREVGLIYGTLAIAATVTPFALGIIADRLWSSERILSILHIAGGVILFFTARVEEFFPFYILILAYTFCYLPTFSLTNSLSFHHLKDTVKEFPKVRVWGTVSWILAGLLVGYLDIEDQATPLLISSGLSMVQGLYCLTLPHTPPSGKGKKGQRPKLFGPEIKQLLSERTILVLLLCIALIRIPSSYYYSFVNPFLNEIGVSNAAGKMSIGQMTEILMIVVLPAVILRVKLKYIIFTGLLIWGTRYFCFAYGTKETEWLLMLGISVHGIAYAFASLTTQIYLDRRVPNHLRATAQGFFTLLTQGAGSLLGAYIAGETVSQYMLADGGRDWTSIWLIPAIIGTIVALFFLYAIGKVKAGEEGESE